MSCVVNLVLSQQLTPFSIKAFIYSQSYCTISHLVSFHKCHHPYPILNQLNQSLEVELRHCKELF